MKKFFLLVLIVPGLYSCEHPDVEQIYSQSFSTTELLTGAQGCDTIITSQRDEWTFVDYLRINGERIVFPVCEAVSSYQSISDRPQRPGVCSDSILTVKYDIMKERLETVQIESDWFKFIKETPRKLSIVIKPNLTGETRHIRVPIFDRQGTNIDIIQSSE
jgi:hypothetical protein